MSFSRCLSWSLLLTALAPSSGAFVTPTTPRSRSFTTSSRSRSNAPLGISDSASKTALFVSQIPITTSLGIDEEFIPCPHSEYDAEEVVTMCMDGLQRNNEIFTNAGVEICYNFATDLCRAGLGKDLETFIKKATNPVFGGMVDCHHWNVKRMGKLIPGTRTRGAMQTCLVHVIPQKGKERTFLWTLQRERRPPRQNCWLLHDCVSVDNAYDLTL